MLGATRKGKADATATGSIADAGTEPTLPTDVQLRHLRDRVLQLEQEQLDGAALIQSLAQQNAQVIQAVEDLRQRNRRLTLVVTVLACTCIGLLVWALKQ